MPIGGDMRRDTATRKKRVPVSAVVRLPGNGGDKSQYSATSCGTAPSDRYMVTIPSLLTSKIKTQG